MKMHPLASSALLFVLAFASCKKEGTNGEGSSSFTYQLQTVNRTSTIARLAEAVRTEGVTIQWTAGIASAKQLKFEAKNSAGEIEFKQNTSQQVDLFSASSALGSITIPGGSYSEVEFKAFLSPSGAVPALRLSGNFTSGGVTRQLEFIVNADVELKAEKANVTVANGTAYSALNNLDLSQLTRGVSETALSNATVTNGVIVLSASSNTSLYNTVLSNLNSHRGEAEINRH